MNVRPAPPVATWGLAVLAAVKILLHLVVIDRYGYFRDELYYLASTEHLSWGYVDHPPLSIALLALVRALFGDSLLAVRVVPVLAGAAVVILTGLMARQLGGGRFAQTLAALAALLAPMFLSLSHFYSMNVLELLAWTLAAGVLIRAVEGGRPAHWILLGIVLGLGLMNKISVLWLCGGIAVGLLLTRYRRLLRERWPWAAMGIAAVLFVPYLLWQVRHGWPTLEFMRNASSIKMVGSSPAAFLADQVLAMNPGAAPPWIAGIVAGLVSRKGGPARLLVWIYLAVLALLLASRTARSSYLAAAYPMLFAVGATAIERFSERAGRVWTRPVVVGLVALGGAVGLPLAIPILPVQTYVRYQSALGVAPRAEETSKLGVLPQHYADMFGWEEMVELAAAAYGRLSPEEQAHCRVFGQNYGEAGAIDVLGRKRGLPPALCPHNSYWFWGASAAEPEVMIIIGGDPEEIADYYERIEIVGRTRSPWSMPYERDLDVSIARGPKVSLREAWPRLRLFL